MTRDRKLCKFSTLCTSLALRWGNAPIDDAVQFNQDVVVSILKKYQHLYDSMCDAEEQKTAQTAKSIV